MLDRSIGVIIVAGGSGTRCGGALPKQFRILGTKPVLAHTIEQFHAALPMAEIVVVLPEEHIDFWKDLAARFALPKHAVVAGGKERFYSVRNGIEALTTDPELIAVQDGVRPLATAELIERVAHEAVASGAAIPVVRPADSFRRVDAEGGSEIVDRSALRCVQTPQIFGAEVLRRAYRQEFSAVFTDDASVVEHAGHAIALVEGEATNLKITTPHDFTLARGILLAREEEEEAKREAEEEALHDGGLEVDPVVRP